jgi:hypothetical protein
LNNTSSDYKKGFEEGIKFGQEFPKASEELKRYFEITGTE